MFDFLKKMFGGNTTCTDCQDLDSDNNSQEAHSFPIEDQNAAPKIVESAPEEVIAQPTLNMNKASEEAIESPVVAETTEEAIEYPVVAETTEEETTSV